MAFIYLKTLIITINKHSSFKSIKLHIFVKRLITKRHFCDENINLKSNIKNHNSLYNNKKKKINNTHILLLNLFIWYVDKEANA